VEKSFVFGVDGFEKKKEKKEKKKNNNKGLKAREGLKAIRRF